MSLTFSRELAASPSDLNEQECGQSRSVRSRQIAIPCLPPSGRTFRSNHDVRELTAARLTADGIAPDLVAGGFPCQDASVANIDGEGTAGERTGLYAEAVRLAGETGAGLLMENVPGLFDRGFGDVLRSLANIGFDAEWECISARDAGADHLRNRVWILAYPRGSRWERSVPHDGILVRAKAALAQHRHTAFREWRSLVARQSVLRGVDGLSVGMERRRLHAVGNSVTPYIPEAIGRAILDRLPHPLI